MLIPAITAAPKLTASSQLIDLVGTTPVRSLTNLYSI